MFWSFHLIFLPNVNGPFPRTAVMATSNSTRLLRYTCCHLILYFIRHQGVLPGGQSTQEVHTIPLIPISTVLRPKSLTSFPHIDTKCIQMNSVLEVTPTKTNFFFLRWCFIKFACHMTNNGYTLILTTNIQIITKACDKEQCHCIALYLNLL